MRDLSIRGAGNLLGKSQSGFIDSVGFELYSQLLEEAIAKRNGNGNKRSKGNAELILQIDAYLPDNYISDQRHKIEIYKKIHVKLTTVSTMKNYKKSWWTVLGSIQMWWPIF